MTLDHRPGMDILARPTSASSAVDDARYRLLVEAIDDYAIYMLDAEGRVSSWNRGAERFKGYTADEIIGQHFSRFYTEEDRAIGLPATALSVAAREGRFEREGWRVRKDGRRFWAHVIIDAIRDDNGELVGFAKITRDLTERRAAEAALRRSEEQFRLLVQGVIDYAIYTLEPDGRISSWNAGAQRIKGYRPDEVIGENFSLFYTPEDRAAGRPQSDLARARSDGRFEGEGWRVRKDGTQFFAHTILDTIRDETGEIIGFAKITRDITERMEAQKALDEAREALFQAQKLEAIGQLTGGVAHDFNNLLMAILGSLELVRKRLPYDPKVTPLIDNAMQGADRGAGLTRRMLAFARKQALTLEAIDVASLVRGMTDLLERSLGPAIQIETRFPRSLPLAETDANMLETTLLNLALNARDAMPDGGLIRISATHEVLAEGEGPGLSAGAYVRLSVTDDGEGMDGDVLARATEPFFTTKGVGKGTGLGLSMAHGLAEESRGRLTIASRKGDGTTVALWLPVARGAEVYNRFAGLQPDDPGEPLPPLSILAVDDDPLVLMNTVAMLEDMGHRVFAAASAADAQAVLRRQSVDLLITDFAMPQTTGLRLAEQVRAERPELPVILATGYAELTDGEGAAFPRLSKPFSQSDLARALRAAMPA